jgi:hypothetical protein
MHKERPYYEVAQHRFHSLLMLCLLLWLTVSTPYVYDAQQDVATAQGITDAEDDNPLSGTNEEKVESGSNNLSEYLHELPHFQPRFVLLTRSYKCLPDDLYLAFHPELVVPPPDGLS